MRDTGAVQSEVSASREWSTPVGLVVVGWILVVLAGLWWLASEAPTDRLFVGVLVIVLAAATAYATACRPRLRADSTGVAVRGLRGTRRWPWARVNVRVERHQRLGRPAELLELDVTADDAAAGLIVFSRLDLGAAPHEVAETLRELQP